MPQKLPAGAGRSGSQPPDWSVVRTALAALEPEAVAAAVGRGEPVTLELTDGAVVLEPGEIEVLAGAAHGLATAAEAGYVVGVATELTDDLLAEGVARDIVRHVNQLRKDAGLAITDRGVKG